jgi:hypothetical protein
MPIWPETFVIGVSLETRVGGIWHRDRDSKIGIRDFITGISGLNFRIKYLFIKERISPF